MKDIYSLGFAPKLNLHTNEYSQNLTSSSANTEQVFDSRLKEFDRLYTLSARTEAMSLTLNKSRSKSRNWKRSLFAAAAVIVLGVGTGVGFGNWYKDYVASQTFDYSSLLIEDYEIDKLEVLNSATGLSYASLYEYGSYGQIAALLHSQGKTPASLSAVQNIALAEFNATQAYSYCAVGVGLINTIVKQPFSSVKTFDGEEYVMESVSSGAVMGNRLDVGNKVVVKVSEPNTTYFYKMKTGTIPVADENGVLNAEYESTAQKYSEEEFIDLNGSPATRMLPYIVSDKTVLDGTTDAALSTFDGKQVYEFTLVLDPVGSVLRYYRQMQLTSGYNPKFSSVSVKIMLDENWNFVRSEVTEQYTVIAMGVPAGCVGTLVTNYVFNEGEEVQK